MQIRTYVYGKSATPLREGTVFNTDNLLTFAEQLTKSVEYFSGAIKFGGEITNVHLCITVGENEREILIEMIRGELRITEVDVTESE